MARRGSSRARSPATATRASTMTRSTPASAWRWPRRSSTSPLLARARRRALDASRGEPAFVFELDGRTLAFVVEGLGTKSIIARHVLERQGINRFADVAYDTVAAILNDLCCVARCRWSSTPTSPPAPRSGIASPSAPRRCWRAGAGPARTPAALGAAGSRRRCPGSSTSTRSSSRARPSAPCRRVARRSSATSWAPGDEIVLVASSGLHANGASLARLVAGRLPDGYATRAAERGDVRRGAARARR